MKINQHRKQNLIDILPDVRGIYEPFSNLAQKAWFRVGGPAAKKAVGSNHGNVVSECPLAREHIVQGMKQMGKSNSVNDITSVSHPIQILAKSYGFD